MTTVQQLGRAGVHSLNEQHATAAARLRQALGRRVDAPGAERAMRDLLSAKAEIEYGATLMTLGKAEPLVRRARTLVDLAANVVQLGR